MKEGRRERHTNGLMEEKRERRHGWMEVVKVEKMKVGEKSMDHR